VALDRPDGSSERIGCGRLILACNGYGGNPALVAELMPEISGALYFGHPGNQGEALMWGRALGAEIRHAGAYQGHGNVAHPHGILITWAVITAGGFQANLQGRRFWDESQGYSEAARAVQAQPEGAAVAVFDERIAGIARQFADFRAAEAQGAVRQADTVEGLAAAFGLPEAELAGTFAAFEAAKTGAAPDPFGRLLAGVPPLCPPYRGVRVTAALFHTQGGLAVDAQARVRRAGGGVFANLHAAGGAACGVSGSGDAGYLSGNGLLAAVTLGHIAGAHPGPAAT
jgi:fumarate reductase flavoprotein subunit